MQREAFLFLTHRVSDGVVREYRKIRDAVRGVGEAVVLYQSDDAVVPPRLEDTRCVPITTAEARALGYPMIGRSLVPGHAHFPVLRFFLDHPGFERYWVIEYDVRFTGDWRTFFASLAGSGADLLASHVRSHAEEPEWPWWDLSHPRHAIPPERRLRCFHPIYRLSRAALVHLHQSQRDGWRGHSEVLIPTLLHEGGLRLEDFGGAGRFVPPGRENRFYPGAPPDPRGVLRSGTMRYRPPFREPGERPDTLYHPVKPPAWSAGGRNAA